ncbi:hypothetical protein AHF37_01544 [Paragonimus kellicotti]|nr:hypothetical protein AHF37_01544 [Paragonimus kellicotti]
MELSGMNKVSEDKQCTLINPAASCPQHIFNRLSLNSISDLTERPNSRSATTNHAVLVENLACSLTGELKEALLLKASLKTQIENHKDFSSISVNENSFVDFPHVPDRTNESSDAISQQKFFKCPNICEENVEAENSFAPRGANSTPVIYSSPSPVPSSSFFASDSQLVNGSTSVSSLAGTAECTTPIGETSFDINGRSGSHTPASPFDTDRTRMDLNKLDDTIDYVLSHARSDDPCEGMFVLMCRMREPTHLSSPNLRANTPSSGHLASPSPSPTPSSPHSSHVTSSPMLNPVNKPHSFLQSSNMPNVVVSHSLSRYVLDQCAGPLQFTSAAAGSQYVPVQCNTQPPVSFVHLYSDPSNTAGVQISERLSITQISQPITAPTQMVFQHVSHGLPNHIGQQPAHSVMSSFSSPTPTILQRNCNSLISPGKVNLAHSTTNQVSKMTSVSPVNRTTTFYSPPEPDAVMPNRTVLISPPGSLCCVVQNPDLSSSTTRTYLPDGVTSVTCSSLIAVERKPFVQSPVSVSFRQPVVPAQSIVPSCISSPHANCVKPVVPDQTIPLVNTISSAAQNGSIGGSKKRSNSTATGVSKRRKTSASTSALSSMTVAGSAGLNKTIPVDHSASSNRIAQECLEKLKISDIKSLVSAPVLKPYSVVLPPAGGSDFIESGQSEEDEQSMLARKALKYVRGAMSLPMSNCFVSGNSSEQMDSFIVRHLQSTAPCGPLIRGASRHSIPTAPAVCPSPEPLSFENHMMALFSSIHKSPKEEDKLSNFSYTKQHAGAAVGSSFAPKLLPIFSEATSTSEKPDPERSTPPLPLFHMPNPKLICEPVRLLDNDRVQSKLIGTNILDLGSSPIQTSGSEYSMYKCDEFEGNKSLLIDSETGDVLADHRPSPAIQQTPDKLHIAFTINPSMTGGIPRIIRRITELLGVAQDSVCYQVTRSGAQITIDQKQTQNESLIRDLENQLREHFTPLSLRFETASFQNPSLLTPADTPLAFQLDSVLRQPEQSIDISHPVSKQPTEGVMTIKAENQTSSGVEFTRYLEEPVSIVSLLANKHTVTRPCQYCDKMVPPDTGCRKYLEDLATLTGLTTKSDNTEEYIFCSENCMRDFVRRCSSLDPLTYSGHETNGFSSTESRLSSTLVCDLPSAVPVVLQNCPLRGMKNLKRLQFGLQHSVAGHKRRWSAVGSLKHKRWRGCKWRVFSPDFLPSTTRVTSNNGLSESEILSLLSQNSSRLRDPASMDSRSCALCDVKGDAPENSVGRLLPLNVNQWLHINCALWCYEVYETLGGSLNNVDSWIKKSMETNCTHCGRVGAGLPCYNPRCTFIYHVSCAVSIGCMFFTDRGMYCPQHQPREAHPMQLPSLVVNRRVYIARDENTQVGSVIHEDDRTSVVRIGTVCLHRVGQLLPHQIESGHFHTRRYIYPVGFRSTRIYWSMRVPRCRARYICEIMEANGRPLFRVTAIDRGMENESVEHEACAGAWQPILSKIEVLREQSALIRLFSQHLKGEDLYGLSEPHIVRAVESLPGVDCLRDYVFNFGRMELIPEMPLAINPSGCARAEPKMQTYVKRSAHSSHSSSAPTGFRTALPGLRRSAQPNLSGMIANECSKQYQSSRSQQYRRLKSEVSCNVILGRSRIQGLGLFAARDLEPQTMVIEYIGELIRQELANKREKYYEAHNRGIYMFRLNDDTVIDATVCGGLARYINHSCQPNCFTEYVNFGDHSHIVIITNRHIDKGEELGYDYNFDLEDGGSKIPCLCRAPNCRKWMN